MIKVVCGVISNAGKIFIARRKPEKSMGGFWEFPGGKVEEGEDFRNALARELEEELGMKVEVSEHLITNNHEYQEFKIELIAYRCKFLSATFEMSDHDAYEWVEPGQLLNWKLAPADIPVAKKLQNKFEHK